MRTHLHTARIVVRIVFAEHSQLADLTGERVGLKGA